VKAAIAGAGGRMGHALIEALENDGALTLAAALDAPGTAPIGREIAGVKVTADIDAAIKACDVLIDFTRPQGTLKHLEACLRHSRAIVIGTTGFSEDDTKKIREASRRIAVAMSPNFAVGVNVLFAVAAEAAKALGDGYDVEIIEAHHRHKVDAPSGTALKLAEVIASALKRSTRDFIFGRQGDTGERPGKQIAIHAIRGGDIVGEHTALFAGVGERLELTVRSQSRMTYASGAIRAAKWLRGKPAGLYDMADVLGLKRP
jgi:4-hydroxy-tetrahydrodipicolinate reductase